ncbi:MAG: hypothetical protein ABIF09_02570 [Gemmatimonadota bacterium]
MPALNALANKLFDPSRRYSDVVHFIHVNVIEPHPSAPDLSPYSGEVWENGNRRPQPRTYADRVALATEMATMVEGAQTVLVDDLTPGDRNNPLWCTYGPAPNSAYLIDRNGALRTVQQWIDVPLIEAAIDHILKN